jgi:hypothetical protein
MAPASIISRVVSDLAFEGFQEFGRGELYTVFVLLPEGVLLAVFIGDGDFADAVGFGGRIDIHVGQTAVVRIFSS